jgi:hypothetical protein
MIKVNCRVTIRTEQSVTFLKKIKERYVEWFITVYTGLSFASQELKLKVEKEFTGN